MRHSDRFLLLRVGRPPDVTLDPVGSPDRILVLPNRQNRPSKFPEAGRIATISSAVTGDFLSPPSPIVFWLDVVPRATVPETTVDEDNDPSNRQYKVGFAGQTGHIRLNPEAASKQLTSERFLGLGSTALLLLHA